MVRDGRAFVAGAWISPLRASNDGAVHALRERQGHSLLAEMADQRADIDTLLTIIQRMHSTRRRASHKRGISEQKGRAPWE